MSKQAFDALPALPNAFSLIARFLKNTWYKRPEEARYLQCQSLSRLERRASLLLHHFLHDRVVVVRRAQHRHSFVILRRCAQQRDAADVNLRAKWYSVLMSREIRAIRRIFNNLANTDHLNFSKKSCACLLDSFGKRAVRLRDGLLEWIQIAHDHAHVAIAVRLQRTTR